MNWRIVHMLLILSISLSYAQNDKESIELNKNNELALPLDEYELEIVTEAVVDFENVVGQDSLTRFDSPKRSKKRRNNRNRNKRRPKSIMGRDS